MWNDLKRNLTLIEELETIYNMTGYLLEDHKIVANNITKELKGAGRVNLTTQKIDTLNDIAAMCKMFRDTRYETFRMLFMKGDQVVGSYGVTSKTPGSTPVAKRFNHSNTEDEDFIRSIQFMKDKMKKLGADGYYIIHNHPSGNLHFSRADISTTGIFEEKLPGYIDHILVGNDAILSLETLDSVKYDDWEDPKYPDTMNMTKLVKKALKYQNNKNASILLYTDARTGLRVVEEVDNYEFNNSEFLRYIINQKRKFGAAEVIGFTEDYDTFAKFTSFKNFGALSFSIFFDRSKNGYITDFKNSSIHDHPKVIKRYNV